MLVFPEQEDGSNLPSVFVRQDVPLLSVIGADVLQYQALDSVEGGKTRGREAVPDRTRTFKTGAHLPLVQLRTSIDTKCLDGRYTDPSACETRTAR